MRWCESAGGGFENRRAADVWVREHRKRRNRRQTAVPVAFTNGLSQPPAIDDETRPVGHLVVEPHRGLVGLVRLPVDAGDAGGPGLVVHALDQRLADALAAS